MYFLIRNLDRNKNTLNKV
jgi:hypothetical protein